jgi:putative copper export protein
MVFMAGWICSNIGIQRMRATGTGTWGRTVLLIQLVGLVLAFVFGFIEARGHL